LSPPSNVTASAYEYYYFGISLAISGNTAVVGAYGDTTGDGYYLGMR
jgi:hypothetical protein